MQTLIAARVCLRGISSHSGSVDVVVSKQAARKETSRAGLCVSHADQTNAGLGCKERADLRRNTSLRRRGSGSVQGRQASSWLEALVLVLLLLQLVQLLLLLLHDCGLLLLPHGVQLCLGTSRHGRPLGRGGGAALRLRVD